MSQSVVESLVCFARQPLLGPMIGHRVLGRALVVGAVLHLAASMFGLTLMPCPVPLLFGVPCPGCGLTRGVSDLLHGHVDRAIHVHAFAPVILLALLLLVVGSLLRGRRRLAFADALTQLERRTCAPVLLLTALHIYWIVRVAYVVHP